jgi:hypothetical protein
VTPFALTSLVPHRRSPVDRPRQFLRLKGRRHLSSRNDFNWQQVETTCPRMLLLDEQLTGNKRIRIC